MTTIMEDELREFVQLQINKARMGSQRIPFDALEKGVTLNRQANGTSLIEAKASASVADDPRYNLLDDGWGQAAFAVILSVDLRNSTYRAVRHGPKATYLTMHSFLPTMAYLASHCGGKIIGLRGDGLFAGFQITETLTEDKFFDTSKAAKAASQSVECGFGMVQAIEMVLNPILAQEGVPNGLEIGVGITSGNLVITRIGFDSATEITAYGSCVNEACKLSTHGKNQVFVSRAVQDYYPVSNEGTVKFSLVPNIGYLLKDYPYDVLVPRSRKRAK